MKTEELNSLEKEIETMNEKLAELNDAELAQISGGAVLGKDDVLNRVQDILGTKLGISPGSVCASSNIIEDLGADSLDVVDVLKSTEERFRIRINPTGLENMKTVQDLCDLVRKSI